ncbi:MotA/TolQ/ExbB proton channel family protein [Roseibaca sp. V10]|uniref:MotA/TolQ/ExbB proton channel family protein n=1 Tax=Roseinatronobacter domitianus TaxID=2940293 RepID=A0ABT0M2V6_9RHOB|nr:MotA/TolQ/ExbB proton channel family protein [Roseibaca domitiana]MCL1629190.1 MotA/TolQ/ExbB proton channel family protein [Roseibaca domitiana]
MQASALAQISLPGLVILGVLAVMSVLGATVFFAKLVQFARAGVGRAGAAETALASWQQGNSAEAAQSLDRARGLRAQVVRGALASLTTAPNAVEPTQAGAMQQASDGLEQLGRNMRTLEGVVQAAPMLGLLGTVVGMIEAFGKLAASSGAADPAQLAGGIWTALLTTAVGLAIAVLFYLASLWLDGRIARERHLLEQAIGHIILTQKARIATQKATAPWRGSAFTGADPRGALGSPAPQSGPGG